MALKRIMSSAEPICRDAEPERVLMRGAPMLNAETEAVSVKIIR